MAIRDHHEILAELVNGRWGTKITAIELRDLHAATVKNFALRFVWVLTTEEVLQSLSELFDEKPEG